jgi:DNA-binding PadR family transcriptional regulator
VAPTVDGPEAFRRRLVGLYALTLMEREGPLHGYGLSERIAQRTEGAWRPGPGSVYPSLRKLTEQGLAREHARTRRREYAITPAGRSLLRKLRSDSGPFRQGRPDLSALWAEVFGTGDVGQFLLHRLHRTLDALDAHLARVADSGGTAETLRAAAHAELEQATARLGGPRRSTRALSALEAGGSRAR